MAELKYSDVLKKVLQGGHMERPQAHWAFGQIMDGLWSEAQIAGLLVALAAKGESVDEITGAAQAMREHVLPIATDGADVIDTCGTGGTGLSTFNVSTAAALVCAGAGVKVAKHGNRTSTRASGSADVLAELGVNINAAGAVVERCLREAGLCFCFAVRCHPAMKYAAPIRRSLGVRTIFNVLGPLTNPAGAKRQLLGVFDAALTAVIANVLAALGSSRAMVVHAQDGLDELSLTAPTKISELRNGQVTTTLVRPDDFGLPKAKIEDLIVASPKESAQALRGVLAGDKGPKRDMVVLNAAAALTVAEAAPTIALAIPPAQKAIDSGAAQAVLEKLIAISNVA